MATKLGQLLTAANKNIVDRMSGLQADIRTLEDKVAKGDATIEELRVRFISSGYKTMPWSSMALELDPPLQEQDIDVIHRLKKRHNAPKENQDRSS